MHTHSHPHSRTHTHTHSHLHLHTQTFICSLTFSPSSSPLLIKCKIFVARRWNGGRKREQVVVKAAIVIEWVSECESVCACVCVCMCVSEWELERMQDFQAGCSRRRGWKSEANKVQSKIESAVRFKTNRNVGMWSKVLWREREEERAREKERTWGRLRDKHKKGKQKEGKFK